MAAMAVVGAWQTASAHPAQFTSLQVKIDPAGGFHSVLNIDILAFALGSTSTEAGEEELSALLDGPRSRLAEALTDAAKRFRNEVVVRTDAGDATVLAWQFPGLAEVEAALARKLEPRVLVPGEIRFSGKLPPGARSLSFRLPYILGDTVHVLEMPSGIRFTKPVEAGAYSSAVALDPRSATKQNQGGLPAPDR